jgi:hypothetical protein
MSVRQAGGRVTIDDTWSRDLLSENQIKVQHKNARISIANGDIGKIPKATNCK